MASRMRMPVLAVALTLILGACDSLAEGNGGAGGPAGGDTGGTGEITMARATWDTGFIQASIYAQLLEELGYDVSDPAELTRNANGFYPALARGEVDMWANGWFPLHDIYLERTLFSGQKVSEPIEPVGLQVDSGALQGYLIDRATADEMGITSMSDLADPSVAEVFDQDGNGLADLQGCNEGWGCNLVIEEHLAELDWGSNVQQVVGDYGNLIDDVREQVDAGEPVLFYTWTPNWTIDVLVPGEDVVWLESPALADDEGTTTVSDLEGCVVGDTCDLGWPVNDIRAVANADFLDENPAVRRLLEDVTIPLDDIAEQNARMAAAGDYTEDQIEDDAATWIEENRDQVDGWLEAARDP